MRFWGKVTDGWFAGRQVRVHLSITYPLCCQGSVAIAASTQSTSYAKLGGESFYNKLALEVTKKEGFHPLFNFVFYYRTRFGTNFLAIGSPCLASRRMLNKLIGHGFDVLRSYAATTTNECCTISNPMFNPIQIRWWRQIFAQFI